MLHCRHRKAAEHSSAHGRADAITTLRQNAPPMYDITRVTRSGDASDAPSLFVGLPYTLTSQRALHADAHLSEWAPARVSTKLTVCWNPQPDVPRNRFGASVTASQY